MTQDDRELIQQAQRGNIVAFEQLVHRYDKRVLSIASTYVNSAEDAKDIYQGSVHPCVSWAVEV